jgi:hypothetical protein
MNIYTKKEDFYLEVYQLLHLFLAEGLLVYSLQNLI